MGHKVYQTELAVEKNLEAICTALDALAAAVVQVWASDATMTDSLGWFAPAITRHELAEYALALAADIRSTDATNVDPSSLPFLEDVPRRIGLLQIHTLPQIPAGNAGQAIPAYINTIQIFRATILPPLGFHSFPDTKSLPSAVARRTRAAVAELDQLAPDLSGLLAKVRDIQAAHSLADNLPIDLQALAEARDRLTRAAAEAELLSQKVKLSQDSATEAFSAITAKQVEAEQLVAKCEEAYHITTTKGLAGAFDKRAERLGFSMWSWVVGLILSLYAGSYIGAHRLDLLNTALKAENLNWGTVIVQLVLSFLSVGAPLWFAWLATKQIGQRFRLAEDYAFKATVAKAYEGYRKEASRIDPAFESILFSSALDRLDEAPLRLVDGDNHSSPWSELANSAALRRAFQLAPDVQDKISQLLRDAIAAAKNPRVASSEPASKVAD